MSNYCQVQFFFFWFARAPEASKLVQRERDTHTQRHRESQSFSSGVVGWVLLLLFSFPFFGFDEIVQPLSSCQSDKEEQAMQEEAWRKWGGKGREVK
jgi:hypothetical protein